MTQNHPINYDTYLEIAIKDLSAIGVKYDQLSDQTKQKTKKLDHIMTMHAQIGNLSQFIHTVREWRDIMIEEWKEKHA